MIQVVLIGSGNVAYHFHKALLSAPGVALKQLVARRLEALDDFQPGVPRRELGAALEDADVYIIAVSDSAIETVANRLPKKTGLVVHTSGALGLETLREVSRAGVLYPLQTFSRSRPLDFVKIPLLIETGKETDLPLLRALAEKLSAHVHKLDWAGRRQLHLAAVFANNFSNHMAYLGQSLCQEAGLPEELLKPLLRETFSKLDALTAYESQTGPARRGDRKTLQAHINLLRDPLQRELYQKISESIQKTYD